MIKVARSFLVYRRGSRRHHALFKGTHAERLPRWTRGTCRNPRSWNRRLSFAICQLRSSRPGELQSVLGTDTRYRLAELTWWQCRRCCNFLWFEDRYFKLNWPLLLKTLLLEFSYCTWNLRHMIHIWRVLFYFVLIRLYIQMLL